MYVHAYSFGIYPMYVHVISIIIWAYICSNILLLMNPSCIITLANIQFAMTFGVSK